MVQCFVALTSGVMYTIVISLVLLQQLLLLYIVSWPHSVGEIIAITPVYITMDIAIVHNYWTTSPASTYSKHKNEKRRMYEARVCDVEHAFFTPLVISATGGIAKQATVFCKHPASLLANKRETSYSATTNWLRCTISFFLLRSTIPCVWGAHSSYIP